MAMATASERFEMPKRNFWILNFVGTVPSGGEGLKRVAVHKSALIITNQFVWICGLHFETYFLLNSGAAMR